MASLLYDGQEGFAGGYNSAGLTGPVAENQFAAMTNVRVLPNGDMAKRPGMRLVSQLSNNSLHDAWSIWAWNKATTTPQIIVQDTNDMTFKYGDFDPTTATITWTTIAAPTFPYRTSGSAHFRDSTNERLYLSNGASQKIAKWSATVLTEGVGTPTGIGQLWVYNQRLFGCTQTDQVLWYSALNDGDTLGTTASGGGFATIRTFGGNNVLGGFALGQSNFILHENAISVFTGRTYDDIQINAGAGGFANNVGFPLAWKVIDDVGYVVTSNGLYFVTEAGITAYRQPNLADPIADVAKHSYQMNGNSTDYLPLASIADNRRADEVWITVTAPNSAFSVFTPYLFIYHKRLKRFTGAGTFTTTPWSGSRFGGGGWNVISNFYRTGHNSQIFALASQYLFAADFQDASFEVFQDNGANYTSSVQCRRFFTDEPRSRKAWSKGFVMMGSGALGTAAVDSATGATVSYTTPIGGTVSPSTALGAGEVSQVPLSGSGHCMDLTITDSGSSSTGWSVSSIEVTATDDGLVGH